MPIRLIQISDTHLFGDPEKRYHGMDTYASLQSVLKLIVKKHPDMKALLVTGDLTQDEMPASYQRLVQVLSPLSVPFYWLCGNHDVKSLMMQVAPSSMITTVDLGSWQVLLLNSQKSGEVAGEIDSKELTGLCQQLEQTPDVPTVLALHHHIDAIDSVWMDESKVINANALKDVLRQYPQVKVIIHGHIHQERTSMIEGVPCFAVPSTCVQFAPYEENYTIDDQMPGYRILDLFDDGAFHSEVVRISTI
ncbi:3',5'-cyclic adenosine monophosphate phosphodiesterase CpdA [invertebrate metagenome]|uniref:3',5'-cyclic adenosine monophosphate phosphodiesterase CpdA n=1 Tax=invertebrate metagenome TaxID=1711999 RepID=A0A2H9TCR6_9ZZZZ